MKKIKKRNGYPYMEDLQVLTVKTHLPTKWAIVDMETGDIWQHNDQSDMWKRATKKSKERILDVVVHANDC